MPYGAIKVDNITFTNGGADQVTTVSGFYRAITSGITVTGTISGVTLQGTTISGTTVTGTTANFTSGVFTTLSGASTTVTSGIFASGSAAAPSLSIISDPNTGLYSPGADQVALVTSGAGRLFVDASGQVGIGTASPSQTLQVNGNALIGATPATQYSNLTVVGDAGLQAAAPLFNLVNAAGSTRFGYINHTGTGGDLYLLNQEAGAIRFGTNNTERVRIDSSGNVGIGTSAPGALLHVGGNTDDNVQAILAQGNDSNFRLVSINKSAANISGSEVARFGIRYATGTSDSSGIQFFRGNTAAEGNLGLYTGGTTRLYVQGTTGNVGIGTTSPGNPLTVSASSNAFISVINSTAAATNFIGTNASGDLDLNGNGSQNILLKTAGTERARIDSSGRLLVGTSTSTNNNRLSQKLSVVNTGDNTYGGISLTSYVGTTAQDRASIIDLQRSRGTTDGVLTSVVSGDALGYIIFRGSDGSAFQDSSIIQSVVEGTPAAGKIASRLVFSTTADGASSPTERMRIKSTGIVNIANTPTYADNAAATSGGLVAGDIYRKSDGTMMITY